MLGTDEEPTAEAALTTRYGPGRAAFERTMDAMRVDIAYLELTPCEAPDEHDSAMRPQAGACT